MAALTVLPSVGARSSGPEIVFERSPATATASNVVRFGCDNRKKKKKKMKILEYENWKLRLKPVKAMGRGFETSSYSYINGHLHGQQDAESSNGFAATFPNGQGDILNQMSSIQNSSNIVWHECSVNKRDRQNLLQQKGCVIWITGLSGSGKSTLACALSHILHSRGKLTYVLDGDNVRHGLNRDLSFGVEDRAENIRRVGEVAKLFADAGVICIASLISPYRKDRDACRAMLPEGDFIEVFMDVPLQICESRDPKGLYKLARAGEIKADQLDNQAFSTRIDCFGNRTEPDKTFKQPKEARMKIFTNGDYAKHQEWGEDLHFTGIDDPYEQPLNCEIVLQQKPEVYRSPCEMAETVISYLDDHGYLRP